MPFSLARTRKQPQRLLAVACATLMPLLLGLPMLYWQVQRTLELEARQAAHKAQSLIETMLDNANAAADAVLPLAGELCENAEMALRQQVTALAFVRSVNLVRDGELYCSSLAGPYSEKEQREQYTQGRLRLMPGNNVTPERALLVLRKARDRYAALVAIDGQHPHNALLGEQSVALQLQVGQHWMRADGQVFDSRPEPLPCAHVENVSARYPFSVHAGYPAGEQWRHLGERFTPLLGLLLALGALAGAGTYRLTRGIASPRSELARAIVAKEFVPYYQALARGSDGSWSGVEVLARWQHPEQGLVPPDQFIPLAESSGLVIPMTSHLMTRVREELAAHIDHLPQPFHIGINITSAHCRDLALIAECKAFLEAFPAGSIILVLELTEREVIDFNEVTEQLFAELRKLDVRLAIDDFGTGHSSLAYLRQFQVDYLKIDRSFVSLVGTDALSRHILDNIVDLCGRLELGIVAEGVETAEQADYLRTRGVDYLQGYLYSRPVPLQGLLATLNRPARQD